MRLNQLKKILRNLKKCLVSLYSLTFLEAWPKPFTKKEAAWFEAEDATWEEMFDSVITDDEEKQNDEQENPIDNQDDNGLKKKNKKRRIKYKAKRLVLNVKETKYHIVRYVGKTMLNMRLSNAKGPDYDEKVADWDVFWCDDDLAVERLYKMKPY